MRILLDEDVPVALRHSLEAEAETVTYRGWNGLSNGDLLQRAQAEYDVLVTLDSNIQDQQNLAQFDIAVVVLRAFSDDLKELEALMPEVNRRLEALRPGQFVEIYPPERE